MIKTIQQIEVQDFDHLVKHTYGKPYSFQQQDGCKERQIVHISVPVKEPEDFERTQLPFKVNGEIMGVSFETWINSSVEDIDKNFDYDWQSEMFWERNFYPHVDMVVNDLYTKGLLPAGKYQINIDW